MNKRLYSTEHLWFLEVESDSVLIGFTPYAPVTGQIESIAATGVKGVVESNASICIVETNKCTVEIQVPFPSILLAVNEQLIGDKDSLLLSEKWICKICPKVEEWKDLLLDESSYILYAEE